MLNGCLERPEKISRSLEDRFDRVENMLDLFDLIRAGQSETQLAVHRPAGLDSRVSLQFFEFFESSGCQILIKRECITWLLVALGAASRNSVLGRQSRGEFFL